MKKVLIALFLIISLVLTSCSTVDETTSTQITTTGHDATTTDFNQETSTTQTTTEPYIGLTQAEVDQYTNELVTLEFEYCLMQAESERMNAIIEAFEIQYPNVTIEATRNNDNSYVAHNFNQGVLSGEPVDLILTNQNLITMVGNNLEPVEKYLYSDASINGKSVGFTSNSLETDFFTIFPDFNGLVSFPFTRQTQVMYANMDLLSGYASTLQSEGITIDSNGYISNQTVLNFDDLEIFNTTIQNKSILALEKPDMTLSTWINQKNITMLSQGMYDFDETAMNAFGGSLRTLGSNGTLYLDNDPSSVKFTDQETVFAVSEALYKKYMIDYASFNVEILPLAYTNELGAVYYGSDFAISALSTDAEKFFAWMFIKFATDLEEDYMSHCLDFGYAPIYSTDIIDTNVEYIDYLALAKGLSETDSYPTWDVTDTRWNQYHLGMIQLAYSHTRDNIYQLSYLSTIRSSDVDARIEAWEDYLDDIFNSLTDVDELLEALQEELN